MPSQTIPCQYRGEPAAPQVLSDHDALLQIQEIMSAVSWSPDTLDDIAAVMVAAGYEIEDI